MYITLSEAITELRWTIFLHAFETKDDLMSERNRQICYIIHNYLCYLGADVSSLVHYDRESVSLLTTTLLKNSDWLRPENFTYDHI